VSDWIPTMKDIVRPKLEAAASKRARAGYTVRDCSKEK